MTGLPAWLRDPALAPTWARLRARLERDGLVAVGRLRLHPTSRDERHALGDLLGRIVVGDRVTVDLAGLDERLRQRSGCGGLLDVLTLLDGPLRDRPAERIRLTAHRTEPLELARSSVQLPWADRWVDELRRTGLLTRAADPVLVVRQAVAALEAVLADDAPTGRSRVELAAQVFGDAHALDEDRLVHRVLLRALAAAADVDLPESAEQRWSLWESYGVSPDLLSATCLTLGLQVEGDDPVSGRVTAATESGSPLHLTRWDLRRWTGRLRASDVVVCENPRVLEAVAELHGGRRAVVCTSGQPNTVVTGVLRLLAAAGCTLRSHGDFDWAGLVIANRLVAELDAVPWLMSTADYEAHARADAPPLVGAPVEAGWDPDLAASMRAFGRSLHEESVLPVLLDRLDDLR